MKVILVEPGASVVQAFSNAYFACKNEPITVCANGVRAIFVHDDVNDEDGMKIIDAPELVEVKVCSAATCTEKGKCGQYTVAVGSICNSTNFAKCNYYDAVHSTSNKPEVET
jgi:hypothetical protein